MDRSLCTRGIPFKTALGLVGLAFLIALMAAPRCALAQDEPAAEPEVQEIGLLFTQTAERGKIAEAKGESSDRFNLVLHGVSRQAVWFQDRPGRQSGHIPTESFADSWEGFGFADDPPNAALSVLDAPSRRDTVILTLGTPRYKPDKEKLVYPARIEDEATGNLAHLESSRDDAVSTRFRDASLFVDDAASPVIKGCVIQPWTSCPGIDLTGTNLFGANISRANFTGANFTRVNLTQAILYFANFTGANFTGGNFTRANFTGAKLTAAKFRNSYLWSADLTDTDLTGADLTRADLTGADLTGSKFVRVTLTRANFTSATLAGLNLTEFNFAGLALTGANLTGANLFLADLTGADLTGANLTGANLTEADFSGARFCGTTMPSGRINNSGC